MKAPAVLAGVGLLAYTAVIIGVEALHGQAAVRQYLGDIEGEVVFYAVNTTLAVLFWAASALLFAVASWCAAHRGDRGRRLFFLGQTLIFFFLAADDRFAFHERLQDRGFKDAFFFLILLLGEAGLLLGGGVVRLPRRLPKPSLAAIDTVLPIPRAQQIPLLLGGVFLALMLVVDQFLPHDLPLRLAVEDLAKLWGAAAFAAWAWQTATAEILRLRVDKVAVDTQAAKD